MKVRLTDEEVKKIKELVETFDSEAEIFVFGSRADLNRKGGDLDLLILSDKIGWRERRAIRVGLIETLGDRKIDLIVRGKRSNEPIVRLAREEGVRI